MSFFVCFQLLSSCDCFCVEVCHFPSLLIKFSSNFRHFFQMNDSPIIPAADQAILDSTLQYEKAVRAKIAALEAKVEGDKVNYDIVHGNLMYSFHTHRRFVKANIKDPRERKALIDKVAHCALDPTEKPNFFKVATRESVEADKKKKVSVHFNFLIIFFYNFHLNRLMNLRDGMQEDMVDGTMARKRNRAKKRKRNMASMEDVVKEQSMEVEMIKETAEVETADVAMGMERDNGKDHGFGERIKF